MKMRKIHNSQESIPLIGQGTGYGGFLAKSSMYSEKHVVAIRYGIDLGMNFIDTAEEYGMGEAEKAVGKAIAGRRSAVFIATKVSSDNLRYDDVMRSAEGSLKRLRTDYIDLYQVHWPNSKIPIEETMAAMEKLIDKGMIRHVGLCNMTIGEIRKAASVLDSDQLISIQAEYNLVDRSIENEILPYCKEKEVLMIAYSPLVQGNLADDKDKITVLKKIGEKYNKSTAQIILNWIVSHDMVMTIPQSFNLTHMEHNSKATNFELSNEDLNSINKLFRLELVHALPRDIRVHAEGQGSPHVYRTIEEAMENRLCMTPSPVELAKEMRDGNMLKPVKVKLCSNISVGYKYDLVEGRLRYWAWTIAFNGKKPIPVLVRD